MADPRCTPSNTPLRASAAARTRSRRLLTRVLLALAIVVTSTSWHAAVQAADDPAARSLFEAGLKLMDEGKVDQACPKFQESLELQPSVGAQLNLARCHELQGKLATAWTEYRKAAALARDMSDTKREDAANMLADGLEAKLPKLVIAVETPTAGMKVTRDGAAVGEGSFGVPLAIDPGEHRIEASAEGYETWSVVVHVPAQAVTRTVAVPELEPRTESSGAGQDGGSSDAMLVAGYVVGATGLVTTTIGAILGGLVLGDASDAEEDPTLCPDKLCSAEGQEVIDGAEGKATAASVLIPVGGACLVAGIVLVVVAEMGGSEPEPGAEPTPTARIVPVMGDVSGLFVQGTF